MVFTDQQTLSNAVSSPFFLRVCAENQFNASFGDIMLVPPTTTSTNGEMKVMLYYGTRQRESGWGEICADNPGNYPDRTAKVICQQYGRTGGQFYR